MSQCLRCSKPCKTTAVFCDECRSLLRDEFRQGSVLRSSDSVGVGVASSAKAAQSVSLIAQEQDDLANYSTKPQSVVQTPRTSSAPITPHPPTLNSYPDTSEQTMSRLSEAAQLISEVDPSNRRLPRASRLAPIRDISADIRRESTPLPGFSTMRNGTGTPEKVSTPDALLSAKTGEPAHNFGFRDSNSGLPDLWPWLESEVEEKENEDTWANSTDPLISRHVPNSVDSARIEEEDIKRALAEGIPTDHNLRLVKPRRSSSLRIVFAVLAILAALALIMDGVLLSVVVAHPRRSDTSPIGPSTSALTLIPNVARVDSSEAQVQVHIVHFPAGTSVQLSHDVQEPVTTVDGSNVVSIGKDGSADATILVNNSWAPGFDLVYAEDITTHYTASAQLQVIGAAPSKPAHLMLVDQSFKPVQSLDFGKSYEGSNTILPLRLTNSGSGSITWSASSNQPWLLVSPSQGIFSQSQNIEVAAQRINLTPGKHTGTLTISSSVGIPQTIAVTVNVLPLIPGPVLALNPAVLSFTTTDGSPAPSSQLLTLNNPGTQPLNWSLNVVSSASPSNQLALAHMLGASSNWLYTNPMSGFVPAGSSQQIHVWVNSSSLLPGAYPGNLVFSSAGAVDTPQSVSVSLTVQQHCGLVTNTGYLSFTAVQGKTNPSNQSLGLNATTSCAGLPINWKASLTPSSGWLSATPASGTLKGTTSEFLSVGANAAGLPASLKPYYGFISFITQKSTQTVMVALTVQLPPAPGAPLMSASPLNLNFSNTQGQPNPQGQVVTITNNGGSSLKWSTNVTIIASSWLFASPSGGSITQNQTGQLVVNVDTSHLSPGTYAGQITLNGMDSSGKPASGSGQMVSINLVVQPPCTLTQPSSSSLAFSGVQGSFNPNSQSLLITGTGNCAWPLTLSVSTPSAPWLSVLFPTGNNVKGSGQSVVFVVSVAIQGLMAGPPSSATFSISATDSAGTIATGSPQSISVTLTVQPPCMALVAPTMAFTAAQGQASPTPQSILLSETGTCSRPVKWAVGTGSSWMMLSTPPPDTGSGSPLTVTVNSAGLSPGPNTGTVSVTATDNNGIVVGSTQTITVTLTVTPTYSVSGTVMACTGVAPVCLTSTALPEATLTLLNSSNVTIATITADASGNYSFVNLSPDTYTVNITGTDAGLVHYSTTGISLSVAGNATGVVLNVYPG